MFGDRLKRRINVMRELIRKLDDTDFGLKSRTNGNIDLLTSFNCDMLMYVIYLSGSDGSVSKSEAAVIRRYLGYDVTPEELDKYIEDHQLSVESYTVEIPLTLQALCFADRKISEQHNEKVRNDDSYQDDDGIYVPSSLILREIYEDLGEAVVYSDNKVDEDENTDYTTFLSQVDEYIMDELDMTEDELETKKEILLEDSSRDDG